MTDKTSPLPENQENVDEAVNRPVNKEAVRKQVLRIASNVRAGGLRGNTDPGPVNIEGGEDDI
jgi:hypothetical protein